MCFAFVNRDAGVATTCRLGLSRCRRDATEVGLPCAQALGRELLQSRQKEPATTPSGTGFAPTVGLVPEGMRTPGDLGSRRDFGLSRPSGLSATLCHPSSRCAIRLHVPEQVSDWWFGHLRPRAGTFVRRTPRPCWAPVIPRTRLEPPVPARSHAQKICSARHPCSRGGRVLAAPHVRKADAARHSANHQGTPSTERASVDRAWRGTSLEAVRLANLRR
jgi:hypothetical protein